MQLLRLRLLAVTASLVLPSCGSSPSENPPAPGAAASAKAQPVAQDAPDNLRIVYVPGQTSLRLGDGVRQENNSRVASCLASQEAERTDTPTVSGRAVTALVRTREEMSSALFGSADVKVIGYGSGSLSVSTQQLSTEDFVYLVATRHRLERAASYKERPSLKQEYLTAASANVLTQCGTHYVSSVFSGARVAVLMRFGGLSEITRQSIRAAASSADGAGWGQVKANLEYDFEHKRSKLTFDIEISSDGDAEFGNTAKSALLKALDKQEGKIDAAIEESLAPLSLKVDAAPILIEASPLSELRPDLAADIRKRPKSVLEAYFAAANEYDVLANRAEAISQQRVVEYRWTSPEQRAALHQLRTQWFEARDRLHAEAAACSLAATQCGIPTLPEPFEWPEPADSFAPTLTWRLDGVSAETQEQAIGSLYEQFQHSAGVPPGLKQRLISRGLAQETSTPKLVLEIRPGEPPALLKQRVSSYRLKNETLKVFYSWDRGRTGALGCSPITNGYTCTIENSEPQPSVVNLFNILFGAATVHPTNSQPNSAGSILVHKIQLAVEDTAGLGWDTSIAAVNWKAGQSPTVNLQYEPNRLLSFSDRQRTYARAGLQ